MNLTPDAIPSNLLHLRAQHAMAFGMAAEESKGGFSFPSLWRVLIGECWRDASKWGFVQRSRFLGDEMFMDHPVKSVP